MLADTNWVIIILLRWLHMITACLLIGATFFLAAILPATRSDGDTLEPLSDSRTRRSCKMLVHISVLFLLGSGIYNAISNWPAYHKGIPLTHALFGPHVLLGLIALTVLVVIFIPREQRRWHRRGLQVSVGILMLAVLCASALKYAREQANRHDQQTTSKAMG